MFRYMCLILIGLSGLFDHPAAWADTTTVKVIQTDMSKYPEVTLYVSVTDSGGRPVTGLARADFRVTEDGVPVTLADFAGIGDTRIVDIVFVFDTTTSMVEEVDGMQRTSLAFAEKLQRSGLDYRLGLVDFGDVINRVELSNGQLTADARQFENWINAIHLAGGGYDIPELSLGAMQRATQMSFRASALKIVILITDAPPHHYGDPPDESVSFDDPGLTLDHTLQQLATTNVTAYIIAPPESDYIQIACETNGQLFDIHGGADFTTIIDQIGGLISTQYRLTYHSPRPTYDGTRRDIRVDVGESSGRASYLETHLLNIRSAPAVGVLCLLPLLLLLILPAGLRTRARAAVKVTHQESAIGTTCRACGAPLRPDAKFCARCGQTIIGPGAALQLSVCPRCQQPLRSGARFCGRCGYRL